MQLVDAGFHDFGGLPPQMFGKYYDNNTYHDKILKKSDGQNSQQLNSRSQD